MTAGMAIGTPKTTADRFRMFRIRPWGLLGAAGLVASLATIFGFMGQFAWFLDILAHFRVQYCVGLGMLGLIHLLAKRWKSAAVFLLLAAVNLAVLLPWCQGRMGDSALDGPRLRVLLLNVHIELGDPRLVRTVILEHEPDVVVLEEISSRWLRELEWLSRSYPHHCLEPRDDSFGIGLFSRLALEESATVMIGDAEVPSIEAKIMVGGENWTIIATHPLPPAGATYSRWRNRQMEELARRVNPAIPIIVIGDLNMTPWSHYFQRFLESSGLRDSSRGRCLQPTWPTYNPLLWIPIDHCLHSDRLEVLDRRIGPHVGSDHYPLIVDLALKPISPRNQSE